MNKISKFLTSICIILFFVVLYIIQKQSNMALTSGASIGTELAELL